MVSCYLSALVFSTCIMVFASYCPRNHGLPYHGFIRHMVLLDLFLLRTWHIVILVPHTLVHSVKYNIKLRLFTPLQHNFIICPLPCILWSISRAHLCSPNPHVLSRGHTLPSSSSFLILSWLGHHATSLVIILSWLGYHATSLVVILPWLGHHATSLILWAAIFYSSLI